MKTYRKGATAERKLSQLLKNHGYYVLRAAKSGSHGPDLIALKQGSCYAIEVKAINSEYLSIRKQQMEELISLFENGIEVFVAWKVKSTYYLIRPEEFNKTKNSYTIKIDRVKLIGRTIYDLV